MFMKTEKLVAMVSEKFRQNVFLIAVDLYPLAR